MTTTDIYLWFWRVFARPFERKQRCPDCRSRVLYGARVCQYCRYRFDQ